MNLCDETCRVCGNRLLSVESSADVAERTMKALGEHDERLFQFPGSDEVYRCAAMKLALQSLLDRCRGICVACSTHRRAAARPLSTGVVR